MRNGKIIKRNSAIALAMTVALSGFVLPKVYAGVGIETDAECAVQIDLRNSGFNELIGDEDLPVTIGFYKVADVDMSGNYTALQEYEDLDFSFIDGDTTQAEWDALTDGVKDVIAAEGIAASAEETTTYGEAIIDELETGLYLLDVEQVVSNHYIYEFQPFMIALPSNYYYSTQDDTWVYDLVGENAVTPKIQRTERQGDLVINKLLDTYNATIGGATFVFQVEAVKTDIDAASTDPDRTRVVFSDVFSMTFNGTGTDSLTIEGLPAGAEVTVTEVYSGASYKATTDAAQTVVIVAEDSVSADFENTYDGGLKGGSGIVNHFRYDSEANEWMPSQAEDSTP